MSAFTPGFPGVAPPGSLAHAAGVRPALVLFGVLAVLAGLLHGGRLVRRPPPSRG